MADYKKEFIEFLLQTGALKVGGDFSLKSKRISPWFVNIGDFNDGKSSAALGVFYANAVNASGVKVDLLYGIPEKGNALSVGTAIAMSSLVSSGRRNVPWFNTRKVPKGYGEATGVKIYGSATSTKELIEATKSLPQPERIKAWVVGRAPKEGQTICQLDDVFTAGDAKYEARELLQVLGNFELPLLAIAVDRQEVAIDGKSAIAEYEEKTGTKVVSVVNALDIYDYLKESSLKLSDIQIQKGELIEKRAKFEKGAADLSDIDLEIARLSILEEVSNPRALERLANYLRVYGTEAARKGIVERAGKLEQKIILRDRSVIPACDVETIEEFEELVKATAKVEGIGGYKVGFELGLGYGLSKVVETVRKYTDKPVIYDHQKAGTDIPDTGKNFARVCKKAGVDAVILFPQAGPETERAWIYHALDAGLKVIVGGRMTHPAYSVSEGGFITDEGALEMYRIGARAGVTNFVVPGNKPEVIKQVREVVEPEVGPSDYFAPGFIAQGGKIEDAAKVAGPRFHGIVGRGIYSAKDMHAAALEHTSQLS